MKYGHPLFIIIALLFIAACQPTGNGNNPSAVVAQATDTAACRQQIATMLDSFNRLAAQADYNGYFNLFTDNAVFCGTDAAERWDKAAFMAWAKPHFDKKKTWDFTALQRHIYIAPDGNTAWFDELLRTQMKICRGSGVVTRQNGAWKVEQYILSATVPNNLLDSVITLKAQVEDSLMQVLVK